MKPSIIRICASAASLARHLGHLRHLLDAGLEDLAGVLQIAADMSEQNQLHAAVPHLDDGAVFGVDPISAGWWCRSSK
jgi:hypothetical protein